MFFSFSDTVAQFQKQIKMSDKLRATKIGIGYEVEQKMEQVNHWFIDMG